MANVIGTAVPHNNRGQKLNVSIGNTLIQKATVTPADTPGTLSVSVTRVGRNYNFTFSVTDTDGIRSLTSATVTANDGRTADATGDFARRNANTFAGTDSRRNARWSSGSFSVVYVDNTSGQSHTLTQNFST